MSNQAAQTAPLDATDSLNLQYNQPLHVPQNFSSLCSETTQATSLLQVQNLSSSDNLTFFVNGGGLAESHVIPANQPEPWMVQSNFGGATLKVSNVSSRPATALVTLSST